MATTGERIKQCRLKAGMTQTELADKIGVKFSAIHKYENGLVVNLKRETIEKLARALNVKPSYLMCMDDEIGNITPIEDVVTFPIIGDIAAGYNGEALEDYTGDNIDVPGSWLRGRPQTDYFMLKVKGDSMYPMYQDGDIILVKRQTTLDHSGQIGVVIYEDTNATLKKVEYVYGEDWMKLIPINPAFPPIMVRDEALEHCRVLGYPIKLIRDIR